MVNSVTEMIHSVIGCDVITSWFYHDWMFMIEQDKTFNFLVDRIKFQTSYMMIFVS